MKWGALEKRSFFKPAMKLKTVYYQFFYSDHEKKVLQILSISLLFDAFFKIVRFLKVYVSPKKFYLVLIANFLSVS